MNNHKRLVLLVENEPYLQQTLVQALNAAFKGSVETQVSSTPEKALSMADAHQYDLVIAEQNLPNITGGELIAKIRLNHPELPAILLSELNPDLISTRTLNLADGFLTKPFELTKFFKVVHSVLQHRSAEAKETQGISNNGSNGSNGSKPHLSNDLATDHIDKNRNSDALKILIVEDDSGLMYIYQKALTRAGYEMFKARNLAEARSLIENGTYDIMICDIQLGRERGIDLIEQYGQELKEKGTQIIMVSSFGEYRHITDDLGIDFFLEKPISLSVLVTMIKRLAGTSHANVPMSMNE